MSSLQCSMHDMMRGLTRMVMQSSAIREVVSAVRDLGELLAITCAYCDMCAHQDGDAVICHPGRGVGCAWLG